MKKPKMKKPNLKKPNLKKPNQKMPNLKNKNPSPIKKTHPKKIVLSKNPIRIKFNKKINSLMKIKGKLL